jgi:uncharacterized protein YcbX
MMITVADIFRYPVKGLGPTPMQEVILTMGGGVPFDRRWAIVHDSSKVDPAAPGWARKSNFLCLAKDEKLAQLTIDFEEATQILTIFRKGKQISRGKLGDTTGQTLLQTFLNGFMPKGPRGNPRIVEAPGDVQFTDTPEARISLINIASVQDLERVTRTPVDPIRFRANFYLRGLDAWQEFEWVGRRIRIGECVFEIMMRIDRCPATNVNPDSGEVDMNIPQALRRGYDHIDCGVHAKVIMGGRIRQGDPIELMD